VVHAGAWTDLDGCEAAPDRARAIHRDATAVLAEGAAAAGAGFVYLSTDSLFSGQGPHREEDPVDPRSVYARTKREGEEAALARHPGALVVRTCIVGWNAQPKRGLVEWFLDELGAGRPVNGFQDVWFTPLTTTALAGALERLIERRARGIFHVAGAGCVSKYTFGVKLATAFGLAPELVRPASIAAVSLRAPRPSRPCLDSSRYQALTGDRSPSLDETIEQLRAQHQSGWRERLRTLLD
jgi:dTDP-4-dehydrorhamnose reductase